MMSSQKDDATRIVRAITTYISAQDVRYPDKPIALEAAWKELVDSIHNMIIKAYS